MRRININNVRQFPHLRKNAPRKCTDENTLAWQENILAIEPTEIMGGREEGDIATLRVGLSVPVGFWHPAEENGEGFRLRAVCRRESRPRGSIDSANQTTVPAHPRKSNHRPVLLHGTPHLYIRPTPGLPYHIPPTIFLPGV